MIIDQLRLANFGIFEGEQTLTLTPLPQRPITLIGGMNGCGKTTLLEAFHFVLFGNRSPFVRNSNKAYDAYLEQRIHKNTDPQKGAYVEIHFRSHERGQETAYILRRSFRQGKAKPVESLEVTVNGAYDAMLSEAWIEHVDRFIPSRLAHLFFFDGEQIESLAEFSQANELFFQAINALLGVDLVEQLKVDLAVLQKRKITESKQYPEAAQIEALEQQSEALEQEISSLKQDQAGLTNKKDRALKRQQQLDDLFIKEGGELFQNRHEIAQKKKEAEQEKEILQTQLVKLASESLPLALVWDSLTEVRGQAEKESETKQSKIVVDHLRKRDKQIVQYLKKLNLAGEVLAQVQDYLRQDIEQIQRTTGEDVYLDIDANSRTQLDILLGKVLEQECSAAKQRLEESRILNESLDECERKLAAVPDEEALAQIVKERNQVEAELRQHELSIQTLEQAIEQKGREQADLERKINKQYEERSSQLLQLSDVKRVLKHSERLQKTLELFREKMIERNASRISSLILESYNQLLHKQGFINHILIEPITYRLSLFNGKQQEVKADKLSAGERQLLAVSMLWALGRASGKPIPVIIDTPLGRLDTLHRIHLVERYFPSASHQVLLLSTDEEIDEKYYPRLQKWIGHAYRVEYDNNKQASTIEKGYFW